LVRVQPGEPEEGADLGERRSGDLRDWNVVPSRDVRRSASHGGPELLREPGQVRCRRGLVDVAVPGDVAVADSGSYRTTGLFARALVALAARELGELAVAEAAFGSSSAVDLTSRTGAVIAHMGLVMSADQTAAGFQSGASTSATRVSRSAARVTPSTELTSTSSCSMFKVPS
jgi:hypothetical protein